MGGGPRPTPHDHFIMLCAVLEARGSTDTAHATGVGPGALTGTGHPAGWATVTSSATDAGIAGIGNTGFTSTDAIAGIGSSGFSVTDAAIAGITTDGVGVTAASRGSATRW
jgi:hypothetical protein